MNESVRSVKLGRVLKHLERLVSCPTENPPRDITGDNPLIPVNELRAQTREYIDILNAQAKLFFNAWLDEVGL